LTVAIILVVYFAIAAAMNMRLMVALLRFLSLWFRLAILRQRIQLAAGWIEIKRCFGWW